MSINNETDGATFYEEKAQIIYDWECPACNFYCRQLYTRRHGGPFELINARNNPAAIEEITLKGLDIDQGMVLKIGVEIYYGYEAIHKISNLAIPSNFFNRLNIWLFRSRFRSKLFYPILCVCRNLLLKFLGRTKINNLGLTDNDMF